jgi:hypothetical protein
MLVFGDCSNIAIQPLNEFRLVSQLVIIASGKRGVDAGCCSLSNFGKNVAITQRLAELNYDFTSRGGIERAC